MVLCLTPGTDGALRLGVVASRRVGGAVQRVRAKRLLREVYRRNRERCAGRCDVLLIARTAILQARWPELEDEFLRLARRAGLLAAPGAAPAPRGP